MPFQARIHISEIGVQRLVERQVALGDLFGGSLRDDDDAVMYTVFVRLQPRYVRVGLNAKPFRCGVEITQLRLSFNSTKKFGSATGFPPCHVTSTGIYPHHVERTCYCIVLRKASRRSRRLRRGAGAAWHQYRASSAAPQPSNATSRSRSPISPTCRARSLDRRPQHEGAGAHGSGRNRPPARTTARRLCHSRRKGKKLLDKGDPLWDGVQVEIEARLGAEHHGN